MRTILPDFGADPRMHAAQRAAERGHAPLAEHRGRFSTGAGLLTLAAISIPPGCG
jgi:hypothetical protein